MPSIAKENLQSIATTFSALQQGVPLTNSIHAYSLLIALTDGVPTAKDTEPWSQSLPNPILRMKPNENSNWNLPVKRFLMVIFFPAHPAKGLA
jgi:hypothetical protein